MNASWTADGSRIIYCYEDRETFYEVDVERDTEISFYDAYCRRIPAAA